jgi:hypothetical protein
MHKPWFDKGYSELLEQRKEAKLQWLQEIEWDIFYFCGVHPVVLLICVLPKYTRDRN